MLSTRVGDIAGSYGGIETTVFLCMPTQGRGVPVLLVLCVATKLTLRYLSLCVARSPQQWELRPAHDVPSSPLRLMPADDKRDQLVA